MMKSIVLTIFSVSLVMAVMAQSGKINNAYTAYTTYLSEGRKDGALLEKAMTNIDEASENETTKANPKTWYYRGYIYQLIYEDATVGPKHPDAILKSADSYVKAIELAKMPDAKKFRYQKETDKYVSVAQVQLYSEGAKLYESNTEPERAYEIFKKIGEVERLLEKYNIARNEQMVSMGQVQLLEGLLAEKIGKMDDAKNIYMQLIADDYNNSYIYKGLANYYKANDNMDKALETYKKGVLKFPEDLGLVIDMLNVYLAQEKLTEAEEVINKAIQLDPNNAQLYNVLADMYVKIEKYDAAEKNYELAIEKDPKFFPPYNNIGAMYLARANKNFDRLENEKLSDDEAAALNKEYEELQAKALPYLEKAHELEPDNLEILDFLKKTYLKIGDEEKYKIYNEKFKAVRSGN